ncbi:hypothetical protein L1887_62047 [Cichorium endivia]|nr:hypothetical protein L1887_62047 [Cichorium endivia]
MRLRNEPAQRRDEQRPEGGHHAAPYMARGIRVRLSRRASIHFWQRAVCGMEIQCRASQLAGAHRMIRKNGTNGARLEASRTLGTGVDRVSKARRACRLSIPPVSPSIRPVHNPTRVFANAPFFDTPLRHPATPAGVPPAASSPARRAAEPLNWVSPSHRFAKPARPRQLASSRAPGQLLASVCTCDVQIPYANPPDSNGNVRKLA